MDIANASICLKAFKAAQNNQKSYLDYRYSYTANDRPPAIGISDNSGTFKEIDVYFKGLRKAIENDKYDIEIDAKKNDVEYLKELKRVPNFYDLLINKKNVNFSQDKEILNLVEKTNGYRHKKCCELKSSEMENVEELNHFLIQAIYPANTIIFLPGDTIDNIHFKGNPMFTSDEFIAQFTIVNLCKVITDDYNYGIPLTNVDSLNELLKMPDLYNRICQKETSKQFSSNINDLVSQTDKYRDKIFSSLSPSEQGNILWLNRSLLQELYPCETPAKENREKYEVFLKLEKVLGEGLVGKIKKLEKPNRCVLLVGTDDYLIMGVVSYIYFCHCRGSFSYYNCLNYNIQRFNKEIFDMSETGERGVLYRYFYGNTLYLKSVEGADVLKELTRDISNRFISDYGEKTSYGMLIVSTTSIENMPEEFVKLSEIVELDTNKQKKMPKLAHADSEFKEQNRVNNVLIDATVGSKKQDGNETLYFDDKANLLWFSAGKKTRIEPKDADVLKAIVDVTLKKNRHFCRKEEILSMVYKVEVPPKQRLPKENDALNSAISTINGQCKTQLGMREKLIDKDDLRMIKLTRNIEIRKL